MCANCFGEHPSSSSNCPKYKQEKEILCLKIKNKVSISEARKIYRQQNPNPFLSRPKYTEISKSPVTLSESLQENRNQNNTDNQTSFNDSDSTLTSKSFTSSTPKPTSSSKNCSQSLTSETDNNNNDHHHF